MKTLSGTGNQRKGPCPIHGGGVKSTSFSVNFSKDCWNCFGECDDGGNILDFVAAMENCTIRDAASKIADWFGLVSTNDEPSKPEPEGAPHTMMCAANPKQASTESEVGSGGEVRQRTENLPLTFSKLKNLEHDHDEITGLGIQSSSAEHFGIGYCTRGLLTGRVAIPIHDGEGNTLAYAGTAIEGEDDLYAYPKNYIRGIEVYNVHRAVQSDQVARFGFFVVTDYLHVVDLFQDGIDNVVALVDPEVSDQQLATLTALPNPTRTFALYVRPDDPQTEYIAGRLARIGFVHITPFQNFNSKK